MKGDKHTHTHTHTHTHRQGGEPGNKDISQELVVTLKDLKGLHSMRQMFATLYRRHHTLF
jgi:hypothetical protein